MKKRKAKKKRFPTDRMAVFWATRWTGNNLSLKGGLRFFDLGASRAPSLSNLGALVRICRPYYRNVKYFFSFYVLTPEISMGLSGT